MAMIRVELESDRRRLPLIFAVLGVVAILTAAILYGIDQKVGLLRVFDLQSLQGIASGFFDDEAVSGSAMIKSSVIPVVSDMEVSRVVPDPVAKGDSADPVPRVAVLVSAESMTRPPRSVPVSPVTWWRSAQRLSRRLPEAVTVTRESSLVDGTFRLEGEVGVEQHAVLRSSVASMRKNGLQTTLTFWRQGSDSPRATYVVHGVGGTDAPPDPPLRASMPVDALQRLAERHARSAGLTRLSSKRPTHEPRSSGITRVEQEISAVGDRAQIAEFGTGLADESQARLSRFDIESADRGLFRVTAALDVLLGKEPN